MPDKISIMFLDDEPAVLDGLRRQLRPFQSAWDMRFISSPVDALKTFDEEPVDIVITDLKMPHISGDTIANLFGSMPKPPAIIILSGHSSYAELCDKITVPFEYLSKPCDPMLLVKTVSNIMYNAPSRISELYDEVLQVVVEKLREHNLLKMEDLPIEYTTLLGIRKVSQYLGEMTFEYKED